MRKNRLIQLSDKYINAVQTFALLIAIGFTIYQVRENTRALEQQEYGALIQQQQDIFTIQMDNSETYVKSLLEPETLSPSELWKITEIIYLRLELLERFQRANENGIIPLGDLQDEFADANIYLGTPIGKLVWEKARVDYGEDSEFSRMVDRSLRANNSASDDRSFFKDLHEKFNRRTSKQPKPAAE